MPTTASLHQRHIEAARRRVAHLGAMAQATDAAERRIHNAAHERLDQVEAALAKVTPRAMTHDAAGDRYLALIQEKARLLDVIEKAAARLPEVP